MCREEKCAGGRLPLLGAKPRVLPVLELASPSPGRSAACMKADSQLFMRSFIPRVFTERLLCS